MKLLCKRLNKLWFRLSVQKEKKFDPNRPMIHLDKMRRGEKYGYEPFRVQNSGEIDV